MTSLFASMAEVGRARDAERAEAGGFFEASMLPDSEKERLCRELLAEFGVTHVRATPKGELIHSCCLPFGMHAHGDRSPAASLNYKKLTYKCFVCGGGGFLWFIATCRGTDSDGARRWLEGKTGTGAEEQTLGSLLEFFDAVYAADRKERPEPIPKMERRILDPWLRIHPYLTDPPPNGRSIPVENLQQHLVGYGTLRVQVGHEQWIDSDRIIIPHFWKGDLVGWQSRRLADDGTAKYLSSPGFPKDSTVYNHTPGGTVIVVESPMSVLRHSDRYHIEATFGASVTPRQIRHLAAHDKVIVWMDNDPAGWKATEDLAEALLPYTGTTWVVPSTWAADPADLDAEAMDALVEQAIPFDLWSRPTSLQPLPEVA